MDMGLNYDARAVFFWKRRAKRNPIPIFEEKEMQNTVNVTQAEIERGRPLCSMEARRQRSFGVSRGLGLRYFLVLRRSLM
jgi:hypothetical protein